MVVFLSGSSRNKQRYKNWKYNLLTDLKDYPVRGWMGSKKEVSNNTFRFCLFVCLKNWVKGAVVLWGREDWMVISLCSVYFSMLVLSDLSHSCVQCSPCHVTTFCTSWLTAVQQLPREALYLPVLISFFTVTPWFWHYYNNYDIDQNVDI